MLGTGLRRWRRRLWSILALCAVGCLAYATVADAADLLPLEESSSLEIASSDALIVPTPTLSVSGETVSWEALGSESFYEIAISNAPRGAVGRTTHYLSIPRQPGEAQSYTLALEPGQTVYVGVSANNGPNWSAQEAVVTAGPPVPQLGVKGETLTWVAIPGVSKYTLATIRNPDSTRETTYQVVTGTSYTPAPLPGQSVNYGLSASVPGAAPWAQEVTITYPPLTSPPPPSTGKIIGTNDGAGWGEAAGKTIVAGHITWNRVEIGAPYNTMAHSLTDGFKVLAIVANTSDNAPISQISPSQWGAEVVEEIKANPGMAIAEAGNEMYLKGGVANPVQYGKMYLAAVNAMKAAGVRVPLLFNMFGDYPKGSNSEPTGWSQDANGGGWLRDAVKGVPGLAAAILANGLSSHPYGALTENHFDEYGVAAIPAQEAVALAVLGSIPPIYITEFGYDLGRCGESIGACSQQEQASKTQASYRALLADPHVEGIWWYESHDDSTGLFGFMNNDNTVRPTFAVLSSFGLEQGQ
jgi:hypothetical protein